MQELSNNIISMDEMVVIIEEQLRLGGNVRFTPKGISMLPMLRNNKDVVVLKRPEGRLKKYDIPLYRRENGAYVLHRVVQTDEDGNYVMCGDNQVVKEYGITDDHIIGVVEAFERKGKKYTCNHQGYQIYCRVWVFLFPFRKLLVRMQRVLGRIKRKIKRIIGMKG